jgi:hypothetical protein
MKIYIDPIHKLHQFSTEVLLSPGDERQVYIFIDEIDSLLSLNFPSDEFFAWIRHCYLKPQNAPTIARLKN